MTAPKFRPIRIQRMNEAELDLAIADLEKRGFKLLVRGKVGYTIKDTKYRQSSFRPYKYGSTIVHAQVYAWMRKEEQA